MTEKMFYLVGNTHDGKFFERFNSYDDAMEYIRHKYAYDKAHENDFENAFVDGYYGIYRISEETAEYYGWDYVYSNWETTEFLGSVNYAEATKDIERI